MNRNVGLRNSVDPDFHEVMLRVVGKYHAQRHKRVRKDSVSCIKGVRQEGKISFIAMLWREGRGMGVGTFRTAKLANVAYRKAVRDWEKVEQDRLSAI